MHACIHTSSDCVRTFVVCLALIMVTSVTAMMVTAMARGVHHGWLPATARYMAAIEGGWSGITSRIAANGTVAGVCMGTVSAFWVRIGGGGNANMCMLYLFCAHMYVNTFSHK